MKRVLVCIAAITVSLVMMRAGSVRANEEGFSHRFHFEPDTLVVTRTVYVGTASTVTVGETLPPGCVAATIMSDKVKCAAAVDDGEFPNLKDSHNVWNNDTSDGNFGVTSPIFLDNITTDGKWLDTLPIPSNLVVTSFSSKSELAINRSTDGHSLTFSAYRGGPGCPAIAGVASGPVSPTQVNLLDVSNSNTPAVCDPTNPAVSSSVTLPIVPTAYYRTVAEVDANGNIRLTDGNAYSGDNGRAVIKADWLYYMVGNDNNGNLSKSQLTTTPIGEQLIASTGAELLVPGQTPPVPPNINMVGDFEVTQLGLPADKAGKDNNFRGIAVFDHTLYVTKGSGSNGINTVYQVGSQGVLPAPSNAPGTPPNLKNVPITILPGFPNTEASTATTFPFGIWFANSSTLYVCDEGDGTFVTGQANGNVADAATLATAGVQKWRLVNGSWTLQYILQDGLNLGVPYSVPNYPASLNPATDGCRNLTGRVNRDGTATIWAVTSTISANGDPGADPNKIMKVADRLSATTLPKGDGDHDRDDFLEHFTTIRAAKAGEVLRGVALAPVDEDFDRDRGNDRDRDDVDRDHGRDGSRDHR